MAAKHEMPIWGLLANDIYEKVKRLANIFETTQKSADYLSSAAIALMRSMMRLRTTGFLMR
jgi:hypothetical protein